MKLLKNYNIDDFEILQFFSYTSTIPYVSTLVEIDANSEKYYPNLCKKFDAFYNKIVEKAGADWTKLMDNNCKYTYIFEDNKTVFKIRHKFSGEVIFIGRYDMRRAIGKKCHLYSGTIYDFKKRMTSGYETDIMADELNLWKKISIEQL